MTSPQLIKRGAGEQGPWGAGPWFLNTYLICGLLTDERAKKGEVLCETLKRPSDTPGQQKPATILSRQEKGSTSTPAVHKQVRSIEEVDFLNFTFSLSEDCMQKTISLRNGGFEDGEIRVQLGRQILYADLTGDNIDEAIVPLYCNTYGNFHITEIHAYTLRNGEPVLFAKLPQSIIEGDYKKFYPEGFGFEIRRVQATDGKLIIHRGVDGSHACPENNARFEYIWNGESFVLAGRPVKSPLRNCGLQEEKATPTPPVPVPVPTPTPPQVQQPSGISDLMPVVLKGLRCGVGLIPGGSLVGQFEIVGFIKNADTASGFIAVVEDMRSGNIIRAPLQAVRIIPHEVCVETIVELLAPGQLGALEQCLAASTPEERACLQNILEQIGIGGSAQVGSPPGVTPPEPVPTPPRP